jgi:DNA-binding response OmpR family regulator
MTDRPAASLAGLRVLVAEDEMLIAMELESMLQGLGCNVVGPVGTVALALRLARTKELDAAVLDVDLHGEKIFPIAQALQARGIPFVFATGYETSVLPEEWRREHSLGKPFRREELEKQMRSISGR